MTYLKAMELGLNIKKRRELLGMTQDDLSERSGVSQSAIANIENGKRKNPQSTIINALARVLKCKAEDLHGETETDSPNNNILTLDRPSNSIIGARLRTLRNKSRKALGQIQADLRIPKDRLLAIEKGEAEIDTESLLKLADYYGVDHREITKPPPGGTVKKQPLKKDERTEVAVKLNKMASDILSRDTDATDEDRIHLERAIQQALEKLYPTQ